MTGIRLYYRRLWISISAPVLYVNEIWNNMKEKICESTVRAEQRVRGARDAAGEAL